jgi:hypothetical protein
MSGRRVRVVGAPSHGSSSSSGITESEWRGTNVRTEFGVHLETGSSANTQTTTPDAASV